jgi:Kdo2-lipid IVA lauroyltransferase/acyltransferase
MRSRNNSLATRLGSVAFSAAENYFLKKTELQAEESGAKLGRFLYPMPFMKKQRTRALSNLEMIFPEWEQKERERVAREVFIHFGRVAGDFLRSMNRTNEEVLASMTIEGQEHADEAFAMKKGIIAVTAHFGNWERLAHWFSSTGGKITVIARDANDAGMQERVSRIRANAGIEVLSRGRSTRALIEKLNNGEILGLLPDQNSEECYIPFMGKMCGTVLGPAKLHEKTGCPIIPAYCARIGPAKYKLIIEPLILAKEGETHQEVMIRVNQALEKTVRQYPEQWLWLHDRWRSARQQGML